MEFNTKFDAKAIENEVHNYLDNLDLRAHLENEMAGKELVGYIEGPPTMNGEPHAGHVLSRVFQYAPKKESHFPRRLGHARPACGTFGGKGAWAHRQQGRKH